MSYRRGRRWEYEVARKLRDEGYFVIRAAGSKPIDLIAIKDGQVMLVECKTKKPSPSEVEELRELGRKLGVRIALAVKGEAIKTIHSPPTHKTHQTNTSHYRFEAPGQNASHYKREDHAKNASPVKNEALLYRASPSEYETPGEVASHLYPETQEIDASPYECEDHDANASHVQGENHYLNASQERCEDQNPDASEYLSHKVVVAPDDFASQTRYGAHNENASQKLEEALPGRAITYASQGYGEAPSRCASRSESDAPDNIASPEYTGLSAEDASLFEHEARGDSAESKKPMAFIFMLRGHICVIASNIEEALSEALRLIRGDNLVLKEVRQLPKCKGYDNCAIYREWCKRKDISGLVKVLRKPLCPYDYYGYCGYIKPECG